MRKLVFIIVNYNDYITTKTLLNNIKDYEAIDKIYVVDNHSTDNSYENLQRLNINRYEVIKTPTNNGFAYALNIGAKKAIDEFGKVDIIFSNSDIIISSNENIEELKKSLDKKNVGLVGPTIVQQGILNRGWKLPSPKDEILSNLPIIGKKFNSKLNYDVSYYKGDNSKVEVISFCFFLIKSEVLRKINFFDENTFLYYEENIACSKVKKTNYQILVNNNITVIHNHSVSVDKNINYINKFKILKKSQLYFETYYNNASNFEIILLKITIWLTLLTLYVRIFIRGGLKNERNNISRR